MAQNLFINDLGLQTALFLAQGTLPPHPSKNGTRIACASAKDIIDPDRQDSDSLDTQADQNLVC